MASLPPRWKQWVLKCLLANTPVKQILKILLDNGFTFEQAKNALGGNLPSGIKSRKDGEFYQKLAAPKLLSRLDEYQAEYIEQHRAQLIKVDHFISAQVCQEIVALAKTKLRPSTIAATSGFEGFRTSTTCDLPYLNHPAADALDTKIIQTLGLGVGEDEVIQAQHYTVGQQFKAHTDYFEPGADEYKTHCQNRGQRTWTFMVYLTEGCEGGETEFTELGISFKPQLGSAIIWNNLRLDGTPNPLTKHQAHPILAGEKVVVTKWFREQNQ